MNTRSIYPPVKRALDVAASAAGLLALAPALTLIAVAVKASSPGPVFFSQERMGVSGRPFRLFKFRTMVERAAGPLVTSAADSRITRIGEFLRRYKLDELPQLVNVLVGDMSLVGPRPEVQCYAERFPGDYQRILSVRPGITDFAAIEYRDEQRILARYPDPERAYLEEVLPAKIKLYHRYLDQMSLRTDFALIARTLLAVIR